MTETKIPDGDLFNQAPGGEGGERRRRVALFDFGYVFRRYWHATEDEEIGSARKKTVQFIASEADGYDAVAVCRDWPPYARRGVYSGYKANRDKASATLIDQLRGTQVELERWGYKVVGVEGFEADDVIATLARLASKAGFDVDIWTADKDIRQVLYWQRTRIIDPMSGAVSVGADMMGDPKFGVPPEQIPQFIALVGDKSDNLPGIDKCGPVNAAKLLKAFGSIESVFDNAQKTEHHRLSTKTIRANMEAPGARATALQVRELAKLNDSLDLDLDECVQPPQQPKPEDPGADYGDADAVPDDDPPEVGVIDPPETPPRGTALVRATRSDLAWERQLEPTGLEGARNLSHWLHQSRLYIHSFSSPQQILAVMLDGRARGIDAATALRCYNVIKGRVSLSSELIVAMVMSAPACEFFQCTESTSTSATWVTKRKGNPDPDRLVYTIEMAKARNLVRPGSPWVTMPETMLRWRGATSIARRVYPDITAGIYSAEEIKDF